jgi:hypothetical protein
MKGTSGMSFSSASSHVIPKTRDRPLGIGFLETVVANSDIGIGSRSARRSGKENEFFKRIETKHV